MSSCTLRVTVANFFLSGQLLDCNFLLITLGMRVCVKAVVGLFLCLCTMEFWTNSLHAVRMGLHLSPTLTLSSRGTTGLRVEPLSVLCSTEMTPSYINNVGGTFGSAKVMCAISAPSQKPASRTSTWSSSPLRVLFAFRIFFQLWPQVSKVSKQEHEIKIVFTNFTSYTTSLHFFCLQSKVFINFFRRKKKEILSPLIL